MTLNHPLSPKDQATGAPWSTILQQAAMMPLSASKRVDLLETVTDELPNKPDSGRDNV